ncbi:MAG TPA: ABC transporter substrate-binding protein [Clostridiales bacterium]|jgi:branched-chain amino acid transport system substrate-binding protein|nr:ABC transporter substrate-binding protein [Clostridiales bacterium]
MKKMFALILVFGLMAGVLAGCGGTASSDEIKIGINYELSGGVASYGQSSVDGIMLAIEEINAAGGVNGKKIVPVQVDNKSDQAEANTLANKLVAQEKVVAILGPATSGAFKAQAPVAQQNKIPVISGSATDDSVTVDETGLKDYVFRICYTDSVQGAAMANFASDNLSATKAVIIQDSSSDYGKGLASNFKRVFTENGGTIVGEESYVAKETDFNAILTKIAAMDFDVIYLPGYYEEAGLIIKQARALGIDAPILGADGFDSPTLLDLAGASALTEVYFTNHYSSLEQDPAVLEFIENFKTKYNREPDAFAALGYDMVYFLADGLKRADSTNGTALRDALAATKDLAGVTGAVTVDENHNAVKSIVVLGLENGEQASAVRVSQD